MGAARPRGGARESRGEMGGSAGRSLSAPLRWGMRIGLIGLVATGLFGIDHMAHPWAAAPAKPAKSAVSRPKAMSPTGPRGEPAKAAVRPEEGAAGAGLPRSLEGTEVDGGLDVDDDGHLVLSPRVIALFDYFFTASGEESDSALRARISAYARERLREPALGEALALLDRYSAYREAGRSLPGAASASPAERLQILHDLRLRHFGDAAEALFGDEERQAKAVVARIGVESDKGLTPEERADRLAEIDDALPAAEKEARAASVSVAQLRADEAALRAGGADEAEVHRFRTGTLGEEATARLEALDRDRAAWKERLDTFRREREQRCHGAGDAACESALLTASFDAREQIRVRAILSMPAN